MLARSPALRQMQQQALRLEPLRSRSMPAPSPIYYTTSPSPSSARPKTLLSLALVVAYTQVLLQG